MFSYNFCLYEEFGVLMLDSLNLFLVSTFLPDSVCVMGVLPVWGVGFFILLWTGVNLSGQSECCEAQWWRIWLMLSCLWPQPVSWHW